MCIECLYLVSHIKYEPITAYIKLGHLTIIIVLDWNTNLIMSNLAPTALNKSDSKTPLNGKNVLYFSSLGQWVKHMQLLNEASSNFPAYLVANYLHVLMVPQQQTQLLYAAQNSVQNELVHQQFVGQTAATEVDNRLPMRLPGNNPLPQQTTRNVES